MLMASLGGGGSRREYLDLLVRSPSLHDAKENPGLGERLESKYKIQFKARRAHEFGARWREGGTRK